MIVLVLNCGSSSVKYQVFDMREETCLASGMMDRVGTSEAILTYQPTGKPSQKTSGEALDHAQAIDQILAILADPKRDGVLTDRSQIKALGHRVVHGGEDFTQSALIDSTVLDEIRECIELAPLHNPANLKGIQACARVLPGVPQVAVFDTAFHQTMPERAFLYAPPYVLYKRHKVRRYGFHGTSHKYVYERMEQLSGRADCSGLRVVTCHLGNGASIAAVKGGKVYDTSMGLTPLEGLVMGTRCGDIDPAVPLYLMAKEELSLSQVNTLMNKHSGLIGISGVSSDMRQIIKEAGEGHKNARLALDIFCYRLRKYIGAYATALGGLDAIVFTGGIGQNAKPVRALTCEDLSFMGVQVDAEANEACDGKKDACISKPNSPVQVWVIPTNEELVIARDTARIVGKA